MGCFLACLGLKEKKKHRKPLKKSLTGQKDNRGYVPLDSDVSINLDIKENITSDSNHLKEKPIQKIKKKVSFNLNVKAYEPIPDYNDDLGELSSETKSTATLRYEEEDAVWSYPPNHRYKNCRDEEDSELEQLGSDFDEIEESEDDDDSGVPRQEDLNNEICESEKTRRQYVVSVLNPVENLSQWKVVKAKPIKLKGQKENIVDASLSNWLELETHKFISNYV